MPFVLFLVAAAVFALLSVRVVPKGKKLVLFRLGKCVGEVGPGIVFLWPLADLAIKAENLVGMHGSASTDIDEIGGIAIVLGYGWQAQSGEKIKAGEHITITAAEGIKLKVRKKT